jgi:hypothetical protein
MSKINISDPDKLVKHRIIALAGEGKGGGSASRVTHRPGTALSWWVTAQP